MISTHDIIYSTHRRLFVGMDGSQARKKQNYELIENFNFTPLWEAIQMGPTRKVSKKVQRGRGLLNRVFSHSSVQNFAVFISHMGFYIKTIFSFLTKKPKVKKKKWRFFSKTIFSWILLGKSVTQAKKFSCIFYFNFFNFNHYFSHCLASKINEN